MVLIALYLITGTVWLINGSWMINKLKLLDSSADLQYLYDIKNLLFLIVSISTIVLVINYRYSKSLLKEQVLNKLLTAKEHELRCIIQDYEIVNKATNDVIWDYNIITDKLKWLHGYKELFGYEEQLPAKATFWDMQKVHPDDRDAILSLFNDLLLGKEHRWNTEYRYLCSNGNYKYVSDRGYLILNEQQQPVRMLGAIQDIDKAKTYSQLLKEQNGKLKEIAWLNSHETRRPLCNISGLIPLIKDSLNDKESLSNLITMLESSVADLNETTHRVNEYIHEIELHAMS